MTKELRELQRRMNAALEQLEKEASDRAQGSAGEAGASAEIAQLQSQNKALSEKLAKLSADRERDLAQLDQLIAQLKPLIEEAS